MFINDHVFEKLTDVFPRELVDVGTFQLANWSPADSIDILIMPEANSLAGRGIYVIGHLSSPVSRQGMSGASEYYRRLSSITVSGAGEMWVAYTLDRSH